MPKKHCEKHYRYVASCPDCVKLNQELETESSDKKLYPDANIDEISENNFSIPEENTRYRRPEIDEAHFCHARVYSISPIRRRGGISRPHTAQMSRSRLEIY